MTEAERLLLTAYLDGALTPDEKERAEALLRSSQEAQQLFSELVSDSLRLKYLRREKLPDDFADRVLALVREELDKLARRKLWQMRLRRWMPVAVAASIVPLIAWCSFLLMSRLPGQPTPQLASLSETGNEPAQVASTPEGGATAVQPGGVAFLNELSRLLEQLQQRSRGAGWVLRRSWEQAMEPLGNSFTSVWSELEPLVLGDWEPAFPGLAEPSVLTSPVRDTERNPFRTLEVQLPPIIAWEQFDRVAVEKALQQGRFLVLDISCREGSRTWERIQSALRAHQIRTILDSRLKSMWKRRQGTVYYVYLENVTASQARDWLLTLHREDRGKPANDVQIRSLIIQPVNAEIRQRLAELLGLPVGLLPNPSQSAQSTGSQVLQEDTLRKLEQLAYGQQGSQPRTQAIAFPPLRYPPSKEIQEFRRQRGQVHSDGYHLLLLVRPER